MASPAAAAAAAADDATVVVVAGDTDGDFDSDLVVDGLTPPPFREDDAELDDDVTTGR